MVLLMLCSSFSSLIEEVVALVTLRNRSCLETLLEIVWGFAGALMVWRCHSMDPMIYVGSIVTGGGLLFLLRSRSVSVAVAVLGGGVGLHVYSTHFCELDLWVLSKWLSGRGVQPLTRCCSVHSLHLDPPFKECRPGLGCVHVKLVNFGGC